MTPNTPRDCDICGLSTRGGPHYCPTNTPTPLNRQELREAVAKAIFENRTDFAWGKELSRFRGVWPTTPKEMRGRLQNGDTNLDFAFAEADAAIKAYEEFLNRSNSTGLELGQQDG